MRCRATSLTLPGASRPPPITPNIPTPEPTPPANPPPSEKNSLTTASRDMALAFVSAASSPRMRVVCVTLSRGAAMRSELDALASPLPSAPRAPAPLEFTQPRNLLSFSPLLQPFPEVCVRGGGDAFSEASLTGSAWGSTCTVCPCSVVCAWAWLSGLPQILNSQCPRIFPI